MDVTQSGTNILTRWYADGSYMKETASGVTKEYTYLGGDAYTAPVVATTQNGVTTYYYLLRDYLGNITHVVNSLTNNVNEYSYDAWGRRRNPTDWSYTLASQPALFADRGFTSHEFLSWFNLYNMNGRMYDPLVGRFLSVDNFVQDPTNSQSYNRYSYGLNNPLKNSDPSGMLLVPNDATVNAYFSSLQTSEFNNSREGGDVSFFSGPGVGRNGSGLNGIYYDWFSGAYRSTVKGNPEIGWYSVYQNFVGTNSHSKDNSSNDQTAVWGSSQNEKDELIANFLGIKGLTAYFKSYNPDPNGAKMGFDPRGGLEITLWYTSDDSKLDYSWTQLYSKNGGPWNFDNIFNGEYSGSSAYYSKSELAKMINGNTISFHDQPGSINDVNYRFVLSLFDGNNILFFIRYGYTITNGITTPYYPVKW